MHAHMQQLARHRVLARRGAAPGAAPPLRPSHCRAAAVGTATAIAQLPVTVDEMTAQAAEAVKRAAAEGGKLASIQVINPVNEKAQRFTSTEAMDYPCSNMKEFETIVSVTKDVLRDVIGGAAGAAADLRTRRVDEGGIDGDLCAVISTPDKGITAVVWPTAEKLPLLKKLAEDPEIGQLIIVNPLWKTEGNLVSEFGVLPWDRKANEEFVAKFTPAYRLYEQRVGAPSSVNLARGTRYETGAVVRVLRVWPGQYTVHVMAADGTSQAIGGFDEKPSYKELEALIEKARKAKLEIFEVAKAASSLDLEAARARGEPAPGGDGDASEAAAASFPTRAQIEAMEADPKAVRRLVTSLGLPGSGAPPKIMARALAVADGLAAGLSMADAVKAAAKLR